MFRSTETQPPSTYCFLSALHVLLSFFVGQQDCVIVPKIEMSLQKFGCLWVRDGANQTRGRANCEEQSEGSGGAREGGRTSSGDFSLPNEAACARARRRNYPLIVRVTDKRGLPLAHPLSMPGWGSRLSQVSVRGHP